jgi:hypothetical protein
VQVKSRLRESNLCAVSLLDALSHNAGEELSCRLNSATTIIGGPAADAAEDERLELLGGIAGEIRELAATGDLGRARVYVGLLRHLAGGAISAGASLQRETLSSDWN